MRGGYLYLLLALPLGAQDSALFETAIRPVLATHCYGCHSAKAAKVQGGLLLDSKAGLDSVVKSGDPDKSRLIRVALQ